METHPKVASTWKFALILRHLWNSNIFWSKMTSPLSWDCLQWKATYAGWYERATITLILNLFIKRSFTSDYSQWCSSTCDIDERKTTKCEDTSMKSVHSRTNKQKPLLLMSMFKGRAPIFTLWPWRAMTMKLWESLLKTHPKAIQWKIGIECFFGHGPSSAG